MAWNLFLKNFDCKIQNPLRIGERRTVNITLSCTRCYSHETGKRSTFVASYPLYLLFCLVNNENKIVFTWCEPIEIKTMKDENPPAINHGIARQITFSEKTMFNIIEESYYHTQINIQGSCFFEGYLDKKKN